MMVTEPGLAHDTAALPWEWGGAGLGWPALAERCLPRAAQPPPELATAAGARSRVVLHLPSPRAPAQRESARPATMACRRC